MSCSWELEIGSWEFLFAGTQNAQRLDLHFTLGERAGRLDPPPDIGRQPIRQSGAIDQRDIGRLLPQEAGLPAPRLRRVLTRGVFQLRDFGASVPYTFLSQKVSASRARHPVIVAGTAASACSGAGGADGADSGSASVDRNEAVTIRGAGSGEAAGDGANSYAAGAGSARLGSGWCAGVSEAARDDGCGEVAASAGVVIWDGSKLSTCSSR